MALGSSRGPETQPLARILRTHTTLTHAFPVWAYGHMGM